LFFQQSTINALSASADHPFPATSPLAKMPDRMSWEKTETWERVIASILASGVKVRLEHVELDPHLT